MQLSDDEFRDVLARAEEIQRESRRGDEMNAEFEAVIEAAGEVGLSRSAVERALRERLDLPVIPTPPKTGSMAFAKSADGKYYAAEVLAVSEHDARVRFLRGSEHVATLDEVRSASLIPGERVVVNWPWWGPWTCTVISYDSAKQRVKVSDGWGDTKIFPVSEIWLTPSKQTNSGKRARSRVYVTLLSVGAAVGAAVGGIATALLLR